MKQRIIATILLLVTVLTMLASCVNYAFAEDSMENYVTLNLDELMKALHSIEIEEEDFGPDEERENIVVEEIYNTILAALNKDTDNEETDGTIGEKDMVKYYYYCSVEIDGVEYTFNHNMKNAVNTLTSSSSSDEEKELKKAIVAKIAADYTFNKEKAYEVKASLSNEKITKDDRIVVSYTLKTTDGTVTKYNDYANKEITVDHDIFKDILDNNDAVVFGSYKPNDGVKVGNNHYLNINISHIIKNDGTSVKVERENKEEQTLTAYDSDFKATQILIPESTEDAKVNITYHVFPVAFVKAPVVDAYDVIKYVLGDDITTDSLPVFTANTELNALVKELVAEYGYDADHYAGEGTEIELAKIALDEERKLAKAQSLRDQIDALAKVKNSDGKTATEAILEHTGKATIYEVFASKVRFADLLPLGVLGLYTFTNPNNSTNDGVTDGTTAVTLVNAINAEHDKNVEKDYENYTKTKTTLPDYENKKIDVADKRERYEDLVAKAHTRAVEAKIKAIVDLGVNEQIVNEYNASVYKTEFLAYDLIKHILLATNATADTFSFIEDLSDYVYGTSTLDDEKRETFSTILTELTAEFAKTAESGYDNEIAIKDLIEKLNNAKEAYKTAQGITETNTTATKSIYNYASNLKSYKNESTSLLDALLAVYTKDHPYTVYVTGTSDKNEKSITTGTNSDTYAKEVLQLIINDIVEDESENDEKLNKYKAVFTEKTYKNGTTEATFDKCLQPAIDLDAASRKVNELTEELTEAREDAKEVAVDNLIAKLLSGVLEETEEDSNKLSVVLPVRYVENTLNTKINTYNTNVKNKLAKAVYEIINNQVVVNTNGEGYPWALVEEFEKTLKESYKSTFYTGTSDKTAAGTYGPAVSAEYIEKYNTYTEKLNEANEAIRSGEDGSTAAIRTYLQAVVYLGRISEIKEGETAVGKALEGLELDYYNKYIAREQANTVNSDNQKALKAAEKALAEAEALLESVKNDDLGLIDKWNAYWDAKAEVKAAKKAVEAATEAIEGTKKTDGSKKALDNATENLEDAEDALVASLAKTLADGETLNFVGEKEAYTNGTKTYSSYYYAKKDFDEARTAYLEAKAIVDEAGEAATEEQKKALTDAEATLVKEAKEFVPHLSGKPAEGDKEAIPGVIALSLEYHKHAQVVIDNASKALTAEGGIYDMLEIETDEDGNVTKEGLKEKIAKAEEFEKGEALTNVEVYGHLDAYLEHVLGYNWEAVIREQAVEQVNEQIKIYAVAKALKDVAANGYENADLGIKVDSYKVAIEKIEARDVDEKTGFGTIKKILAHSIEHNDEDINPNKLKREVRKSYDEILEATGNVFVDNKVFKEYKKDIGNSSYTLAKDQYGENNLRVYLQIENLLTYLLYTDVQVNDYAIHDGEYTVRELENGKLAYLFINYEFKAED